MIIQKEWLSGRRKEKADKMPYKVEGKNVLHEKGGKWSIKQKCSSHENALKAMRLLQGIEHGKWHPTHYVRG